MQPSSGEVRGEMPASASAQMALRDLHGDHRREQMQNPSLHDDFFDQMLSSLPSAWPDHGNPKSPWDADASGAQKLFRIDLAGKQLDESPADNGFATYDESSLLAAQLRESQSSGGSSPTGNTMVLRMSSHHMLPTMGQPPTGAGGGGESGHLPLPLSLGSLGPTDPRLIVEATGDDVDCPYKSPDHNRGEDLYSGFGGSLHTAQAATGPYYQHPPNYVGAAPPAGVGQCPAASATSGGGTVAPKQRVRARRGQATDPHSIAERLRRERIAERMKALQELVPNANKTDKASMLDEIIEYVKFLQLQVKVLSMSRLGGAAAVAPLVADLSSEGSKSRAAAKRTPPPPGGGGSSNNNNDDNVTLAEHRVAKLMEEDMGSAMQYLQGKGLCLMPISLASAISSAACRPVAGGDLNPAPPAADAATKGVESPPSPIASALTVQSAATNGASKP